MIKTYLTTKNSLEGWDRIWRAKPKTTTKLIEVLKKSEVEKEIESFEKLMLEKNCPDDVDLDKIIFKEYFDEDSFFDVETKDWQDFKTKLLGDKK
jgi:hypothetical protein